MGGSSGRCQRYSVSDHVFAALRECKDNHVAPELVKATEPVVRGMMGKAFWVMNDTQYQNARNLVGRYAASLRKSLDSFYAHGGADPLKANTLTDAKPSKIKIRPAESGG